MAAFIGLIFVVIGLIHFYLWKRLIKDPLRPGRARKIGAIVAVCLAVLVPVTLIGTRTGFATWLAWPGYLWLALMFYLLVTLAVLEIPRLVIKLAWRARRQKDEPANHRASAEVDGKAESANRSASAEADGRAEPAKQATKAESEPANETWAAGKDKVTAGRRTAQAGRAASSAIAAATRRRRRAGPAPPA